MRGCLVLISCRVAHPAANLTKIVSQVSPEWYPENAAGGGPHSFLEGPQCESLVTELLPVGLLAEHLLRGDLPWVGDLPLGLPLEGASLVEHR